jgi:RNA polymerase sigma-70 factor, ECF subfamily
MALSLLADEDLMQLVRRGDAAAFEVVYERHATAAFSLAYRMTGKRATAEDVVQ